MKACRSTFSANGVMGVLIRVHKRFLGCGGNAKSPLPGSNRTRHHTRNGSSTRKGAKGVHWPEHQGHRHTAGSWGGLLWWTRRGRERPSTYMKGVGDLGALQRGKGRR
jgi:hypothetical protein